MSVLNKADWFMPCATEIASIHACIHSVCMRCCFFFPHSLGLSLYLFMHDFHFCMQMSREAVHAHRKFSLISLWPADLPKEDVAAVQAPVIKWFVRREPTAAPSRSWCRPRPHTYTHTHPATTLLSIISRNSPCGNSSFVSMETDISIRVGAFLFFGFAVVFFLGLLM